MSCTTVATPGRPFQSIPVRRPRSESGSDYMNRIVLAFWIAINAGPASQSGQKSFGLWQEAVITFRVRQGDQDVDSGSKQNFFPETVAHDDPSVGFDALSHRYRSDIEVHADAVSLGPR